MKGWCAKITEGKTRLELVNNVQTKKDGFIVSNNENNEEESEEIPFV
jgi:uncharacterized protein YrrD